MTSEEALRGSQIDPAVVRCATLTSLLEELIDDGPVHALERQLAAKSNLAAGTSAVAGLDPGSGERRVVEHAQIGQANDRAVHELAPISRLAEPPPDLGHRPSPDLEEPGGRLEDDRRVVDRCPPLSTLRRRNPIRSRSSSAPRAPVAFFGHSASAIPSTGSSTSLILLRIRVSIRSATSLFARRKSFDASRP